MLVVKKKICTRKGKLSSVGSEHLPYKQGVAGSSPAVSTESYVSNMMRRIFFIFRHSH